VTQTQIIQQKPDHHFRSETPNIVFELGLSLPALGLYSYLKRTTGDGGVCWKRQAVICKEIGVSPTTYVKYRDELATTQPLLGGKPLISVHIRKKEDGSNDTTTISMIDIWRENGDYFRSKNNVGHPKSGRPPIQNLDDPIQILDGEEEQSKKNPLEEDNVTTVPSFPKKKMKDKPDRFINKLTPDQRQLHDLIVKTTPRWGAAPESVTVCAWFLAKKWSNDLVAQGFKVYQQDAAEAAAKGRSIDNMGGAIVAAINSGRKPRNVAYQVNRELAIAASKANKHIEITERYAKFKKGNLAEEINFDLPSSTFVSTFSSLKQKLEYEEV